MITKEDIRKEIRRAAAMVREKNPMAPSVTNTVTINFVANAQLAVGGSAAMVYLPDEGEDMAGMGDAFYINMGTQFPVYAETLPRTAKALHERKKPWVLDPVGIGIGALRENLLCQFRSFPPSILRGNASEILAVAKLWKLVKETGGCGVRGVDSTDAVESAREAAIEIARCTGGAVAISGPTDLVTDGRLVVSSAGGSPFLSKITGAGCSLGGVMAVYATQTDPFCAALTGVLAYNLAGKRAEAEARGPGSFQMHFLDELYLATPEDIAGHPFEVESAQQEVENF